MPEPSSNQILEALKFSHFRFKLIEFLKLRHDISERALREMLERDIPNVLRNYLARAERVDEILKSEDTLESEDTIEMSAPRLVRMDHSRGDSANR